MFSRKLHTMQARSLIAQKRKCGVPIIPLLSYEKLISDFILFYDPDFKDDSGVREINVFIIVISA